MDELFAGCKRAWLRAGGISRRRTAIVISTVAISSILAVDPFGSETASAANTVADIPDGYYEKYVAYAKRCDGLGWWQLAAVGKVMTNHGRADSAGVKSGTGSTGRAGPMMFSITGSMGNQWAKYQADGDQNGSKNVYSGSDSIKGLADFICDNSEGPKPGVLGSYNTGLKAFIGGGRSAMLAWVEKVDDWSTAYRTWTNLAARVVETAKSQIGVSYKYGGSPTSWSVGSAKANNCLPKGRCHFDCSSFTQWAFGRNGVAINRTAASQYNNGKRVPKSQAQAGDLVFFADSGGIFHVGLVVSKNMMIDSPHTGANVRIENYASWSGIMPYVVRLT